MIKSLANSSIANEKKYRSMMAGSVESNADHLIAETVLTSTTASVTFDVSSLAALGYKHLQIRYAGRSNRGDTDSILTIAFNGATSTYRSHYLYGNGSTAISADYSGAFIRTYAGLAGATLTSDVFSAGVIDIADFSSATKNKTVRSFVGICHTSYPRITLNSGAWFNTAAITSITLTDEFSTMIAGSRFSLYASKG